MGLMYDFTMERVEMIIQRHKIIKLQVLMEHQPRSGKYSVL
jgi:hypothetical protein